MARSKALSLVIPPKKGSKKSQTSSSRQFLVKDIKKGKAGPSVKGKPIKKPINGKDTLMVEDMKAKGFGKGHKSGHGKPVTKGPRKGGPVAKKPRPLNEYEANQKQLRAQLNAKLAA